MECQQDKEELSFRVTFTSESWMELRWWEMESYVSSMERKYMEYSNRTSHKIEKTFLSNSHLKARFQLKYLLEAGFKKKLLSLLI